MDKVKDITFLVFVKHLFWTLSIIIFVMGFVAWWMSAGSLQDEYTTNKGKISTAHSTAGQFLSTPEDQIYNDATHEGMEAENLRRSKDVYLAWREKYSRQREDVLVWPAGLSPSFLRQIEKILGGKPIEEVEIGADRDLITTHREEFRTQISELLPKLADAVNAKWLPVAGGDGGRGGRGGRGSVRPPAFGGGEGGGRFGGGAVGDDEIEEAPAAVDWSSSDQGNIQARHFNFFETADPPTTIEILYAMEDYWVLKALMQIVARTNTDESGRLADAPYKATIREIHSIDIGKEVETRVGQVTRLAAIETEGNEGELGGERPAVSEGPIIGEDGVYNEASAQVDALAEGRYVDGKQQPVPAATLKSAATGKNEEEAYLAVAKRMPVRMRVKMDQRKLNKFLVECGNGDLMLEVLQVRINPDASDALSGAVTGGSSRGQQFGGRNTRTPSRGEAGSSGGLGEEYPWDVVVEIYGIIYIFNPPSIDRLGLTPEDKQKLDVVDLKDADAVEAAAAEPSDATPPADADATDEPAADEPAADEPAVDAPKPGEEAARAEPVAPRRSDL